MSYNSPQKSQSDDVIDTITSKSKLTKTKSSVKKAIITSCPKSSILEKLNLSTNSKIKQNKNNKTNKATVIQKQIVTLKEKKPLISEPIPDYDYEAEAMKDLEKQQAKINKNPDKMYENLTERFINKQKIRVKKEIDGKIKSGSQTIKDFNHEVVRYKNNDYIVCCVSFNDIYKIFIADYEKKIDIINKSWHYANEGNYIAHTHYTAQNIKKELYLHNFVMGKLTFDGKGQQHTIDHISRNGLDNRKANLREVTSQTAQNFNQKRRERITELPAECGITTDQIPKNIYYGKPNGLHGDFFYIELKGIPSLCPDGKKYSWKSTKSKAIALKLKLQQTIDKLFELKNENLELADVILDEDNEQIRKKLIEEYNDIIFLSHYPQEIINDNLIDFKTEITEFKLEDDDVQLNDKLKQIKDSGKKKDNLPQDCHITIDMIPKYCYYKPETDLRGGKFIIDRHPKLIQLGQRQWSTTESKKTPIQDKFKLLKEKLKELEES
jgi:hypothetical protein